jgi:hypothetical protein
MATPASFPPDAGIAISCGDAVDEQATLPKATKASIKLF